MAKNTLKERLKQVGEDLKIVKILHIENNDEDALAVKQALRELAIKNPIFRVKEGLTALSILRGRNGYKKLPRPYIIILSLQLPYMTGIQFLEKIRRDLEHKDAMVFVLTGMESAEQKLKSRRLDVAGLIMKNKINFNFVGSKDNFKAEFVKVIKAIEDYWGIVDLPPEEG